MKLFAAVATLALGLEIEQGGKWGETECINGNDPSFLLVFLFAFSANIFKIEKLGNATDVQLLTQFNAEAPTEGYKLEGNVVEILADGKDRGLMGRLVCRYAFFAYEPRAKILYHENFSQDETELSSEDITGSIMFKNLPNALTNLDGDVNKRIECEAIGYPLPSLKWRFQAIGEEVTYLSVLIYLYLFAI